MYAEEEFDEPINWVERDNEVAYDRQNFMRRVQIVVLMIEQLRRRFPEECVYIETHRHL